MLQLILLDYHSVGLQSKQSCLSGHFSRERPSNAQWEEAPTEEEGDRGVMLRRRSKGPEVRGQKREVESVQEPPEPFSTARGRKERKC